jgi:parallel beta-helix repeat protein
MYDVRTAIALVLLIAVIMPFVTNSMVELDVNHDLAQDSEYEELWITSDSDFVSQGWPGNGSSSNPFVLSDLNTPLVFIRNTRTYFVVQNCVFQNTGVFELRNVTNGVILNNQITNGNGIFLQFTSHCQVLNNQLRTSDGIDCDASNFTLVENNTIVDAYSAITIHVSSHTIIRNNTLYRSRYQGIRIRSDETHYPGLPATNNSIYYNNIGCAKYEIALDYGEDNIWDDNVSRGNNWYGYEGSGTVQIDGSAGSVDRYPSVFDIDCEAPELTYIFFNKTSPEGTPPLPSFTYEVSVEDPSGVDTVLLYYRIYVGGGGCIPPFPETVFVEMEYQPTMEDPHRYVHTIAGPLYGFSSGHYYWANDTMGNSVESPWDSITFGPYKSHFDTMIYNQNVTILALIVFSILALIYSYTLKWKPPVNKRLLQSVSVKLVMPLLVFLVPYDISLSITTYSIEVAYFGAGWFSTNSSMFGQFYSIIGINTGGTYLFPTFFIILFMIQLPFIISMNRYFNGKTTKKQTQILGLILYILLPLLLNLFSYRYFSPTYFSVLFLLPVPIVYFFGLLLMRYLPSDEQYSAAIK